MRIDIKNAETYVLCMGPMLHIRKNLLRLSQMQLAEVAGVSQATVSRWEKGLWEPDRNELTRIREWARENDRALPDAAFFDPPAAEVAA